MVKIFLTLFLIMVQGLLLHGQEEPNISSTFSTHNQVFFNKFLINPAFSYVREDRSYLNFLHRNKFSSFEDNDQNYLLGFNYKMDNQSSHGIGIHLTSIGVMQRFGVDVNYAKSIMLGNKSALTFGVNLSYLSTGLNRNRVVANSEDNAIAEVVKENTLAFQPGLMLSLGNFDFGIYGKNLVKYNQRTSSLETYFELESLQGQVQYTLSLGASDGNFKGSEIVPLLQLGRTRQGTTAYAGSLLFKAPKLGWVQSTVGNLNGASLGLGMYLGKKMMFGYLLERNLFDLGVDLGWNHELTLAYSLKNNGALFETSELNDYDEQIAEIVRNYEDQIANLKREKAKTKGAAKSVKKGGDEMLNYLMARQDSLEIERTKDLERRFTMMIRAVRTEIRSGLQDNRDMIKQELIAANNTKVENTDVAVEVDKRSYKYNDEAIIKTTNSIRAKPGYYVIVNVFKNKENMQAFIKGLKEKGIDAGHFYNSENDLNYVYLGTFDAKTTAQTAYVNDWEGKYKDEKWILKVQNNNLSNTHFSDDE